MAEIKAISYVMNGKKVVLRNAVIDDAENLISIMKKVDTETTFLLREPEEFTLTIDEEKEYIQSKQGSEVDLLLLAEVEGKIIGACGLNGSSKKRLRHSINLGISILRDYWGMGIGKKLIETGINCAKENDISRITLQVDANNFRAINLYLKLGFEIEGMLKNDKRLVDGTYINSYTMALLI